jgi:hypothetical protein
MTYTKEDIQDIYDRATQGDAAAQYEMAYIHSYNVPGVIERDEEKSLDFLLHAAQSGHKKAQVLAAFLSVFLHQDQDAAWHWLRVAVQHPESGLEDDGRDLLIVVDDEFRPIDGKKLIDWFREHEGNVKDTILGIQQGFESVNPITKAAFGIYSMGDYIGDLARFKAVADNAEDVLLACARKHNRMDMLLDFAAKGAATASGVPFASFFSKEIRKAAEKAQPSLKEDRIEAENEVEFWKAVVEMSVEERSVVAHALEEIAKDKKSKPIFTRESAQAMLRIYRDDLVSPENIDYPDLDFIQPDELTLISDEELDRARDNLALKDDAANENDRDNGKDASKRAGGM